MLKRKHVAIRATKSVIGQKNVLQRTLQPKTRKKKNLEMSQHGVVKLNLQIKRIAAFGLPIQARPVI